MTMNIDLFQPDFVIDCADLKNSKDIYEVMRSKHIVESYVYAMINHPKRLINEFIKVGMSNPDIVDTVRESSVGERITRQAAWLLGWPEGQAESTRGKEFWVNMEKSGLFPNFNKNHLCIAVWDITARMPTSDMMSESIASKWAEGELAKQHKQYFKCLPPLNFADPSKCAAQKGSVSATIWNNHFDIVNAESLKIKHKAKIRSGHNMLR